MKTQKYMTKQTRRKQLRDAFVQGLKDGPRLALAPLRGALKGAIAEFEREANRAD